MQIMGPLHDDKSKSLKAQTLIFFFIDIINNYVCYCLFQGLTETFKITSFKCFVIFLNKIRRTKKLLINFSAKMYCHCVKKLSEYCPFNENYKNILNLSSNLPITIGYHTEIILGKNNIGTLKMKNKFQSCIKLFSFPIL